MRWVRLLFAIPIILLGAILISLTINSMGNTGHIIMKIIGFGCLLFAVFIGRNMK